MKKMITLFILGVCLNGCSKKDTDNITSTSSVSFTFTNGGRTNLSDTSINCNCQFKAVVGGNLNDSYGINIDTTKGYVFSYTGNKYALFLSFEIPQLVSGTYSFAAFSSSWPMYLHYDQWEKDQASIYTDSATITINISRFSKGSIDGTFSLLFNHPSNGSNYVSITNGKLLNIPVQ